MELSVLVLADYANTTGDRKLNVMGIFDTINCPQFPARHPEMFVVLKLSASPAEGGSERRIQVRVLDDDGKLNATLWEQKTKIPKVPFDRRAEIVSLLQLRDLVFERPGVYEFSVLVDGDDKGSVRLYVTGRPGAAEG